MSIGYGFLSSSRVHVAVGATVIGIGNGVSSGQVMLLGTDLAPDGDPKAAAEFIGKWYGWRAPVWPPHPCGDLACMRS